MKLITPREKDILDLIGEGHSTRGIAELLNISVNTVWSYRRNLLKKFDVNNSPELIKKAIEIKQSF